MEIKNKTALITGGSTGIGKAIAESLIEKESKIIVFGINKPDYDCEFHKVDVSKEEKIKKEIGKIDRVDILINNAGIFAGDDIESTTTKDLNSLIDINLKGTFWMCKYTIPIIPSGGCIINIGSISGIKPRPGTSAYSLTKAAIANFTKALALELVEKGIRANCIAPGVIDTPMWEKTADSEGEGKKDLEKHANRHPLKRPGGPEEIAHAAIFLIENDFTTGVSLAVDGGATI